MAGKALRTAIISDSWGYGLMEIKPFPLWQARYCAIRHKALLVPEYGVMYVAAFLKSRGVDFEVLNLIADVFTEEEWFKEREFVVEEERFSTSPIGGDEALRLMQENLEESLRRLQPEVLFFPISIYYVALHAREMLRRIKDMMPEVKMITGGVYSTMHPQEILDDGAADFVIRGEGEWTAWELWQALSEEKKDFSHIAGLSWRDSQGEVVHNRDREREKDLDRFPHIYTISPQFKIADRHRLLKSLIPFDDYIPGAGFLTSRGCPEECTFCLDPAIWKRKTRYHSPAYVKKVLEYCWENFTEGDRSFYFGDATFALNRPRLKNLLGEVKEIPYTYHIQTRADSLTPEVLQGLRDSNFGTVALGAESFDNRILNEVVKKRTTREEVLGAAKAAISYGLQPILTFIVGLPGESRDSLERTVEILKEEGIPEATFFPLVVFRGTELYEWFKKAYPEEERDKLRLNPWSEEYCFVNDEFPTIQELIDFTFQLNETVRQ